MALIPEDPQARAQYDQAMLRLRKQIEYLTDAGKKLNEAFTAALTSVNQLNDLSNKRKGQ